MSISFRFKTPVRFETLLEESVRLGLTIHFDDPPYDTEVWLGLDGNQMLASTGDGEDTALYRYGENDPTTVLAVLRDEFGRSSLTSTKATTARKAKRTKPAVDRFDSLVHLIGAQTQGWAGDGTKPRQSTPRSSKASRREDKNVGKRRRRDSKRNQRAESKRQEKIRQQPAWKVQAMEELTKDRKYLIEQNWDTIRDVAAQAESRGCPVGPGKALIVCVVDDAYGLGQHYGTEAGEHMLAWRRSRGEHALMWTVVGWDDVAGAIPGSRSWSQFRAMTEDVERESPGKYLAVCLINGADGVGVGYGYSLAPASRDMSRATSTSSTRTSRGSTRGNSPLPTHQARCSTRLWIGRSTSSTTPEAGNE